MGTHIQTVTPRRPRRTDNGLEAGARSGLKRLLGRNSPIMRSRSGLVALAVVLAGTTLNAATASPAEEPIPVVGPLRAEITKDLCDVVGSITGSAARSGDRLGHAA
jgi:hypothetical protein